MPRRRSSSTVFAPSPSLKRTIANRSRRTSSSSMAAASFASSKLISNEAMAATRLQRVWHSKFKHALTKDYAAAFFNDETGVTIDGVKNMRCVCLLCGAVFPYCLNGFLTQLRNPCGDSEGAASYPSGEALHPADPLPR
jgi:hypothetical protein